MLPDSLEELAMSLSIGYFVACVAFSVLYCLFGYQTWMYKHGAPRALIDGRIDRRRCGRHPAVVALEPARRGSDVTARA